MLLECYKERRATSLTTKKRQGATTGVEQQTRQRARESSMTRKETRTNIENGEND